MAENVSNSTPRKGTIRDARGRRAKQLDPVALHLLHRHDPIERETLVAIVTEKGVRMTRLEKASMISALVVLAAMIGVFAVKMMMGDPLSILLRRSVPLLYMMVLPFIMWGGMKRSRFGKTADAMLKHFRCPHCGYSLRGLPPDPNDRATVCPECGCAWTLDQRSQNASHETSPGEEPAGDGPEEAKQGIQDSNLK